MDSLRRRRHRLLAAAAAAAAVALLFLVSALGCGLTRTAQEGEQGRRHLDLDDRRGWRRVLVGPGSSPPTCRGRCGGCLPCRPVHVAVQPSRSFPLEYYPEAWRCKCGNKLFMP